MQYRISELLTQLASDHGQQTARGRFMLWLEACYGKIRTLPWSWNFEKTDDATKAPVELAETYDFTKGSNVIATTLGGAPSALQDYTGRYIIADEQTYRIVSIGLTATDEIELDRPFIGDSVTEQTITLIRIDFVVRASAIKSVEVDNILTKKLTGEMFYATQKHVTNYLNWQQDTASVRYYNPDNSFRIPKPKYPPHVTNTAAGSGPTAGSYEYFFTYRDKETGYESAPGPSEIYSGADGKELAVRYRGLAALNVGETTYELVLYRSLVKDGQYTRYPMFEIGTKDAADTASIVSDTFVDTDIKYNDRYYDGHQARIVFLNYPDDIYRVHILHTNGWGARPHPDDWIELGDRNELLDAISHYFELKRGNQNRDPQQSIAAWQAFLAQLQILAADDEGDNIDVDDWTSFVVDPYSDEGSGYSPEYLNPIENTWQAPFV